MQGLCALFAPGNRHAVVGTKEGTLQILDIGASAVLDTLQAHQGPVRRAPVLESRPSLLLHMTTLLACTRVVVH